MTKKKEEKPIEKILTEEDDLELVDPKLIEHNKAMRKNGNIILMRNGKQVVVQSPELMAKMAAGTYQFYLLSATGKAYAGGGSVILDADGISLYGQGQLNLKKADGTPVATIDMTVQGGRDCIKVLTVGSTKDIVLESGGYVLKLSGDGKIQVLGGATLDVSDADSNLRLPCKTGVDGAHSTGDIWLRTDL